MVREDEISAQGKHPARRGENSERGALMADTILQSVCDYFLACPLMPGNQLNVEYLPESTRKNGIAFSIDVMPVDPVIRQYLGGDALCQFVFTLSSVNDYGESVLQNITNNGLYENLSSWLQRKTRKRDFPNLPTGMTPQRIEAINIGYLFESSENTAKYQIQCRLTYYREAGS